MNEPIYHNSLHKIFVIRCHFQILGQRWIRVNWTPGE